MSNLNSQLEDLKYYYKQKLSVGRTDPIARMLLARIAREINELERKIYEQERRQKEMDNRYTRRLGDYVRKIVLRLQDYKNSRRDSISGVSPQSPLQNTGATQ